MADDDATSGSMARVLAIPELLESTLANVDIQTLLVSAQRVSRYWNQTITCSPKLQQGLFFRAAAAIDNDSRDEAVVNPLLQYHFGKTFFNVDGMYDHPEMMFEYGEQPDFNTGNWAFFHYAGSFQDLPWSGGRFGPPRKVEDLESGWYLGNISNSDEARSSRERFTRRGASWRKMLVSQPPPPHLGCTLVDYGNTWHSSQYYPAGNEIQLARARVEPSGSGVELGPGVRMGQLYDIVQHRAGHPGRDNFTAFRVIWNHRPIPWPFKACSKATGRLLKRTTVVLEFYHGLASITKPMDPRCEQTFDAAFRCAAYQTHDIVFKSEIQKFAVTHDMTRWRWHKCADVQPRKWYGTSRTEDRSWNAKFRDDLSQGINKQAHGQRGYRTMPVILDAASLLKTPADVKIVCSMDEEPELQRTKVAMDDDERWLTMWELESAKGDWIEFCEVEYTDWRDLRDATYGKFVPVWYLGGREPEKAWCASGFLNRRW